MTNLLLEDRTPERRFGHRVNPKNAGHRMTNLLLEESNPGEPRGTLASSGQPRSVTTDAALLELCLD